MKKHIKITTFILLFHHDLILADEVCDPMTEAFSIGAQNFEMAQTSFQEISTKLSSLEASCKTNGSAISQQIAHAAEGLSCQAQNDAQKLNQGILQLSQECSAKFTEVEASIGELREFLGPSVEDATGNYEGFRNDPDLVNDCEKEVKEARRLAEVHLQLNQNLQELKQHSENAAADYGNAATEAARLKIVTENQGASCGQMASLTESPNSSLALSAKGAPLTAIKEVSPRTASTVTGNIQNTKLSENSGTFKVEHPKPLDGSHQTVGAEISLGRSPASIGQNFGQNGLGFTAPKSKANEEDQILSRFRSPQLGQQGSSPLKDLEGATIASVGNALWAESGELNHRPNDPTIPSNGNEKMQPPIIEVNSGNAPSSPLAALDRTGSFPSSDGQMESSEKVRYLGEMSETSLLEIGGPYTTNTDIFARIHRVYRSRQRQMATPARLASTEIP